ncbi:hypothetical protein MKW94_021116, partial [Papaver nudicaule]|nr:hypothetical protein [Papaver nudicaule]
METRVLPKHHKSLYHYRVSPLPFPFSLFPFSFRTEQHSPRLLEKASKKGETSKNPRRLQFEDVVVDEELLNQPSTQSTRFVVTNYDDDEEEEVNLTNADMDECHPVDCPLPRYVSSEDEGYSSTKNTVG